MPARYWGGVDRTDLDRRPWTSACTRWCSRIFGHDITASAKNTHALMQFMQPRVAQVLDEVGSGLADVRRQQVLEAQWMPWTCPTH